MSNTEGPSRTADADARGTDPGQGQLAAVYARALLGAVKNSDDIDRVGEELYSVAMDVIERQPVLRDFLSSPRTAAREKSEFFDRVLGGRISPTLLNFLKVVAQHNRLDCLRSIALATRDLVHELRGRLRVQVRTAETLDAALRERVTASLSKALKQEVVLEEEVDPNLLGGIVVRVGDQVIDGSVSHQLECMRQDALRRTRQEIQNHSERFAAV